MIVENVHIVGQEEAVHIQITGGKITSVRSDNGTSNSLEEDRIIFNDAIAFPGLINSHDHLDFNLFPKLGNRKYNNYREWGTDIHQHDKEVIQSVLKIPKEICIYWGILKNLICGVTTVVQHGKRFNVRDSPINIFNRCHSLHSVMLEKNWILKLNNPFARSVPFVIHIGEGCGDSMLAEINLLAEKNFLKRKLIAVHAIAMTPEQAKFFKAVIWCPDSNIFLYGETAKVNELKKNTRIIFGCDSALSANWNIYEQLRIARSTNMLSEEEIYHSLTCSPAEVWKLSNKGTLACGKHADLVVAKQKNYNSSTESFYSLNPEDILLVIVEGNIVLVDADIIVRSRQKLQMKGFSKITVNGTLKWIKGNLKELIKQTKKYTTDIPFGIKIV